MKNEKDRGWSPYVAGGLTGLLIVLSVLVTGNYFGASTSFVRTAAMIEKVFGPEHVLSTSYFIRYAPKIDWQWVFVVGIFFGALLSSLTSGSFLLKAVPDMWQSRFGPSGAKRGTVAFIGGAVAMFGARLAGGCPSGHGLSGLAQLATGGYVALTFFFVGGIIMTWILYGRPGRK